MRQLQQHRQRIHRPGFTLIELLVVISVITILFSLTVGALSYNSDADRVTRGTAVAVLSEGRTKQSDLQRTPGWCQVVRGQ